LHPGRRGILFLIVAVHAMINRRDQIFTPRPTETAAPPLLTPPSAGEIVNQRSPGAKHQIKSRFTMREAGRTRGMAFLPREWSAEARPRRRRIRGRARVDGEELLWHRSLSLRLRPRMAPPSANDPPRPFTEVRQPTVTGFAGGGPDFTLPLRYGYGREEGRRREKGRVSGMSRRPKLLCTSVVHVVRSWRGKFAGDIGGRRAESVSVSAIDLTAWSHRSWTE
jgi:hypothetical protein